MDQVLLNLSLQVLGLNSCHRFPFTRRVLVKLNFPRFPHKPSCILYKKIAWKLVCYWRNEDFSEWTSFILSPFSWGKPLFAYKLVDFLNSILCLVFIRLVYCFFLWMMKIRLTLTFIYHLVIWYLFEYRKLLIVLEGHTPINSPRRERKWHSNNNKPMLLFVFFIAHKQLAV